MPKYCLRCCRENADDKKICAFCGYSVLDELEAVFPFIRENLLLVASIRLEGASDREPYFDYHQYLEFRKINPKTQAVEFSDKLECIHTAIAAIPYEQFQTMREEAYGSKETLSRAILNDRKADELARANMGKPDQPNISLKLSLEDAWFAFRSWVQGISESGLDALKLQMYIDAITESREVPIAGFLFKCLIQVDPEFIPEFLAKIEKECRFEGEYHRPSLRANLYIVLNALSRLHIQDSFKESVLVDYLRMVVDLDADFLFTALPNHSINKEIKRIVSSREEFTHYPEFRHLFRAIYLPLVDNQVNDWGFLISEDIREVDIREIKAGLASNPGAVKFPEFENLLAEVASLFHLGTRKINIQFLKISAEFHPDFLLNSIKSRDLAFFNKDTKQYDEIKSVIASRKKFDKHLSDSDDFYIEDLFSCYEMALHKDLVNSNEMTTREFDNNNSNSRIVTEEAFDKSNPNTVKVPELIRFFAKNEQSNEWLDIMKAVKSNIEVEAIKYPNFIEFYSNSYNWSENIKFLILNPESVRLPKYRQFFTNDDPQIRRLVAKAEHASALPEFKLLFTDEDPIVRRAAAENLHAPAWPEYQQLFNDEVFYVRLAADRNPNAKKPDGFKLEITDPHYRVRREKKFETTEGLSSETAGEQYLPNFDILLLNTFLNETGNNTIPKKNSNSKESDSHKKRT